MKKAYLVTFSPCIRVIAESEEQAINMAIAEINKAYPFYDCVLNVEDDKERPYTGNEPERHFLNPDLKNDFGAALCPDTGMYITDISEQKTMFVLSIWEDGNGTNSHYKYDKRDDAHEDLITFYSKVKQAAE